MPEIMFKKIGLTEDIYLCFIFLNTNTHEGSSYSKILDENIFYLVENYIAKYLSMGHILLAGD